MRAVKKTWSAEEDKALLNLIEIHGLSSWSIIASSMLNRTGKQCRERYFNHLQPNIKKGFWTEDEDNIIIYLQGKIGNQWSTMAKSLPGRTDNAIKNRWHAIIKAQQSQDTAKLYGDGASNRSYEVNNSSLLQENRSKRYCLLQNHIELHKEHLSKLVYDLNYNNNRTLQKIFNIQNSLTEPCLNGLEIDANTRIASNRSSLPPLTTQSQELDGDIDNVFNLLTATSIGTICTDLDTNGELSLSSKKHFFGQNYLDEYGSYCEANQGSLVNIFDFANTTDQYPLCDPFPSYSTTNTTSNQFQAPIETTNASPVGTIVTDKESNIIQASEQPTNITYQQLAISIPTHSSEAEETDFLGFSLSSAFPYSPRRLALNSALGGGSSLNHSLSHSLSPRSPMMILKRTKFF